MTQRQNNYDQPPKLPESMIVDGPDATDHDRYHGYLNRWFWKFYKQILGTIPPPQTAGGHIIQDETVNLTQRQFLNFTGSAVTASDNSATGATDVTISGGFTAGGGMFLWGSGRDGSVDFDGTNTFSFAVKTGSVYVLTRAIHCTNCFVRSGVTVTCSDYASPGTGGGMQVFCTGTLTVESTGHLQNDGQVNLVNQGNASSNWSGVGGVYGVGSLGGASNAGTNGSAGSTLNFGFGGNGGIGGHNALNNKNGGAAGVVNVPADSQLKMGGINQLWLPASVMQFGLVRLLTTPFVGVFGGGAGGGGAGVITGNFQGGAGADGGSCLGVFAKIIAGSGIISCDGGHGNPGDWSSPSGGGGGGGGGGILMVCTTTSNYASLVTARCSGGIGGTVTSGQAGANGVDGTVVTIIVQ